MFQVGCSTRLLHEVGPVAERVEGPVFFARRRAGDAGLGGVELATVHSLQAVQAVVGVELIEVDGRGEILTKSSCGTRSLWHHNFH